MICKRCLGKGMIYVIEPWICQLGRLEPCPDCKGKDSR